MQDVTKSHGKCGRVFLYKLRQCTNIDMGVIIDSQEPAEIMYAKVSAP